MSIYDVDFEAVTLSVYPTHKRKDNLLNRAYSLFGSMNYLSTIFSYYRNGATCGGYSSLTTYTYGDMVVFQRAVYFRNEITSGYASGINPSNNSYWIKVLDDFIGVSEKIYFGPQKIVLEYALNRIFQTSFRQPPLVSDIYIVNNDTTYNFFDIGIDDTDCATIPIVDTDADYYITFDDGDPSIKDFTVFVPNAVLSALASSPTDQVSIISSVVNRYRLAGYLFSVTGY
jgi:hypothetical protein